MKTTLKNLPASAALILSLVAPLAMADNTATSGSDRDKVNNSQASDKADPYIVEDSKDGLTSTKKPVRKLDHKQKTKGDKSVDSSNDYDQKTSGTNGAGNKSIGKSK